MLSKRPWDNWGKLLLQAVWLSLSWKIGEDQLTRSLRRLLSSINEWKTFKENFNKRRRNSKRNSNSQNTRQQEAEALLTEKSKEALGLFEERAKLLAEVERLKEMNWRGKMRRWLKRKRPSPTTLRTILWALRTLLHKPQVFIMRWTSLSLVWARPWLMGNSWKSSTLRVTHNIWSSWNNLTYELFLFIMYADYNKNKIYHSNILQCISYFCNQSKLHFSL